MEIYEVKITKNNKETIKWYYKYRDPITRNIKTKVCRGCTTKQEAAKYVSSLKITNEDYYLVKNITSDMFIPGSQHLQRIEQFGKKLTLKTINQKRKIIELINEKFGNCYLNKIKISEIEKYLMDDFHSGSWKNSYLETFATIYDETIWKCPVPIPRPKFQKFSRNSKKADILSTEELNQLFKPELWDNYKEYLLFYLIASSGLRLGEARALRPIQFNFEKDALLVDGFCKQNGDRTNYNKSGSNENKKYRVTPLPDEAKYQSFLFIKNHNIQDNDFMFLNNAGKPYRPEYLEKLLKKQIDKAHITVGKRRIIPHSLRYTYITRMRRNIDGETVRKIAGHNSIQMTEYYTRAAIPEMIEAVKPAAAAANRLFE